MKETTFFFIFLGQKQTNFVNGVTESCGIPNDSSADDEANQFGYHRLVEDPADFVTSDNSERDDLDRFDTIAGNSFATIEQLEAEWKNAEFVERDSYKSLSDFISSGETFSNTCSSQSLDGSLRHSKEKGNSRFYCVPDDSQPVEPLDDEILIDNVSFGSPTRVENFCAGKTSYSTL